MLKRKQKYNIVIVGATGLVGTTFIKVLEEYNYPINNLRLCASKRSKGKVIKAFGDEIIVEELTEESFAGCDIALFSAGGEISKIFAPIAVKTGALVIDNSSAWRMDESVPLIVPEVNHEDIPLSGIIANPNCSTIQSVLPLKALDEVFGVKAINYSTYQAISGAGQKGIDDYNRALKGESTKVFTYDITKTVIPHIDDFLDNGYTKEEMKMVNETKKIINKDILVSATCIRVPVENSHGVSMAIELEKDFTLEEVYFVLSNFKGIVVIDDYLNNKYPLSTISNNTDNVYVGRIRRDLCNKKGLLLYCVADNIRKGAASNAVQIALEAIKKVNV